jgi:steroid delta-isomerase-like uncharacterized protein
MAKTAAKATPTDPSPEVLARKLIEAVAAHDLDALAELQHEDVVDDFVAVGVYRGRAAVRAFFAETFSAFPDFRIEIVRVTAAGDMAIVEWKVDGTFTGAPFQGIRATGKRVAFRGVDCMQFEGGRLRHNTIYYDGAGFARDVGVLPAKGSAAEKAMFAAFNTMTAARRTIGV